MSNPYAIETTNLNYSFSKHFKAVNNLNLQVPMGSIFGFLGPNGAGKTTTIRLLAGMLPSHQDNIHLLGKSLKKNLPNIFEEISTLIETPSLYLHLNAFDNLKIICVLRKLGYSNINATLELVGLLKDSKRKVKEYSLGMKQRLGIAMALISNPKLLILDEPINGLDPSGIIEVRELLQKLNQEHKITIFISSHILSEVEKTCTHVSIIHKGNLEYQGSLKDLYNSIGSTNEVIFKVDDALSNKDLIKNNYSTAEFINPTSIKFQFNHEQEIGKINQWLVENNINVSGINSKIGLEDWFIKITSKK